MAFCCKQDLWHHLCAEGTRITIIKLNLPLSTVLTLQWGFNVVCTLGKMDELKVCLPLGTYFQLQRAIIS